MHAYVHFEIKTVRIYIYREREIEKERTWKDPSAGRTAEETRALHTHTHTQLVNM